MSWKDWSYQKKGLIIGLLLGLFIWAIIQIYSLVIFLKFIGLPFAFIKHFVLTARFFVHLILSIHFQKRTIKQNPYLL